MSEVDQQPGYGKKEQDITRPVNALAAIYAGYIKRTDNLVASALYQFVIHADGTASGVHIIRPRTDSITDTAIIQKISSLQWRPARVKGKPVCCNYTLKVMCFLWQEE